MESRYFYALAGAITFGVLMGTVVSVPITAILFLGLLGAVFFGLALWPRLAPSVLLIALFTLTTSCTFLRTETLPPLSTSAMEAVVGEEVTLRGVVVRDPEVRVGSVAATIAVDGALILVRTDSFTELRYGDTVTVTGRLNHPEAFVGDTGRSFNYPGYLAAQGVGYTLGFAEVTVAKRGGGSAFYRTLFAVKEWFRSGIKATIPEPQAGLALGLLLGEKGRLPEALADAFAAAGLSHIVVLSGYNIMLVVAFFMYVLAYLVPYRTRLALGFLGVALFALMVGLSATVLRASVMASILLLMRFAGLTHHALRALTLAGVVMLLHNPYLLLYDVGFQLSFLATFAIIVVMPRLERLGAFLPTFGGIRELFLATLSTQLFLAPVILYQIGTLSLIALLVNVLVLPVVPFAMLAAFLSALVAAVSSVLGLLVGYVANCFLGVIIVLATTAAAVPYGSVTLPPFPLYLVPLGYAGALLCAWCFYRFRQPADPLLSWVVEERLPSGERV